MVITTTTTPSLHVLVLIITPLLFFLLLLISSPATATSSDPQPQRIMTTRRKMVKGVETEKGLLVQEKTRLGSTPPSCHNKCNQCHPCWAVQVPTLPSHDLEQLIRRQQNNFNKKKKKKKVKGLRFPSAFFDVDMAARSNGINTYSNYKPLGWKCHCRGHFYNA